MPRLARVVPVLMLAAVACGPATTASSTASPLPGRTTQAAPIASAAATVAPVTAAPTTSPTAAPTPDTLTPRVVAAIAWPVDINGTVVLGLARDETTILYDLADGSISTLDLGRDARARAISERVVVGSAENSTGKKNLAFVLDREVAAEIPLGFGTRRESTATAADGSLVAGTAQDAGGVFVFDLETGRVRPVEYLDGESRVVVAAVSGRRLAGTYGEFDAERAWLYDLDTGRGTDLHALVNGSNSWALDMDGDLVVGEVETPITFVRRPWVFDMATGLVTDLGTTLGITGAATSVAGTRVAGTLRGEANVSHAFLYDYSTRRVTTLPDLPPPDGPTGAPTTSVVIAMSGDLVLGVSGLAGGDPGGLAAVVWDLSSLR